MEITDKHFIDWENHVFGYGYGTGETHTLLALRKFMAHIDGRTYDYKKLEDGLGVTVAWLLINTLCHEDVLEYGASPRFGWLTEKGEMIKKYITSKIVDELYELTAGRDYNYTPCYPKCCNCDTPCNNPLF